MARCRRGERPSCHRGKFEQCGIAEFVDGFLLLVQRAIDPDQGEIVSEDAIEKGFVVFSWPDKVFSLAVRPGVRASVGAEV